MVGGHASFEDRGRHARRFIRSERLRGTMLSIRFDSKYEEVVGKVDYTDAK